LNILSKIRENSRIPLDCSIDEIMGGGIEKGTVTQFYGPPGSGKTNIAMKLLVQCVKNGKKAIFIDTEGGLSVERIRQIADNDFDNLAGNIIVFEPTNFKEQDEVLRKIENIIKSQEYSIELVILDSAVALYRLKEGDLSQLNRELGKQMGYLSRIARKYNIAVIITNHIYSVFDGTGMIEPVGGTILKYWSKNIVELMIGDDNGERFAILKRHKSKPEGLKVKFKIVENGLK
jgi:DNA repair protein RadB